MSQVLRHRAPARLGRAARVSIALAVVVVIAGGAYYAHAATTGPSGCTTSDALTLQVAAAADITPVIRDTAARWQASSPRIGGRCVHVDVVPDGFAAQITAANVGGSSAAPAQLPAMWVPDSSAAIGSVLATDQTLFTDTPVSIASSPVGLAAADGVSPAAVLGRDSVLDLGALMTGAGTACASGHPSPLRLGFDNPMADPAALAVVGWLAGGISDQDCLIETLRSVAQSPNPSALLGAVGHTVDAVPSSEQAVAAYDATHAGSKLEILLPTQSGVILDYPVAIVADLPADVASAAEQFRAQLTSAANRDIAAKAGFRAPDGTTSQGFSLPPGGSATKPNGGPLTNATAVAALLKLWGAANTPARVLTLLDTAPSMTTQIGTETRLRLLQTMAGEGLGLFQPTDKLGIWTFGGAASANTRGYTSVVEPDTLGGAQLTKIRSAITAAKATGANSCGLYPALVAAYKSMLTNYAADRSNTLIVFTDTTASCGQNASALTTEIQGLADADRPIGLIILSIGTDASQSTLTSLTQGVGGTVFQLTPSSDIKRVFLESLMTLLGG